MRPRAIARGRPAARAWSIEARLHNDGRGPVYDEIVRLQAEKAKTSATPNYLIVDPSTGETLRSRAGVMRESTFLEFLEGKGTE
jgi:hypothetical protein